jgi:hypothetical protein
MEQAASDYNDWFSMRDSRENAVGAGATFARLGDAERLAIADDLVNDLDSRFLMLVLALGATILVLTGWLLVWNWHRSPGRVRWPGMADLVRQESVR